MQTMGKILIALTCLAGTLPHAAAGESAGPTTAAKPASLASAPGDAWGTRMLKPVTWGLQQPSQRKALEQKVALAASHAVGADKALLRRSSEQGEIVIDLLVAYTRRAAEHYYEIEREVVELAIEEANHSFRLSGIGHVRLRLAHTFLTGYSERGSHFDQVWSMADKDNEHMRRIHALREAYRADVAILIVDDASGCGLATRVGADAHEAFAVVHHECAVANYTVAHEIGHLIGARHELGYVSGTSWRDIMSSKQECGGCPRLPLWSNPSVLIGGEPAGTTDLNNAGIIAENAWRVASFR
jgi:peptidyl-Asp metalloendopeptidase